MYQTWPLGSFRMVEKIGAIHREKLKGVKLRGTNIKVLRSTRKVGTACYRGAPRCHTPAAKYASPLGYQSSGGVSTRYVGGEESRGRAVTNLGFYTMVFHIKKFNTNMQYLGP